jgi:hypothetical protein
VIVFLAQPVVMYIVRQPLRCLSFLLSATSVSTSVYLVYVSGTLLSVKKQKECVGVCMAVCGCVCVCVCVWECACMCANDIST